MASILCLAHYCDTHGPTPLMVTEALPVGCTMCFEEGSEFIKEFGSRRPSTSSRSLNPPDGRVGAVRGANRANSTSTTTSSLEDKENDIESSDHALPKSHTSSSPAEAPTPPESPRVAALQGGQNGNPRRRDSSFRKTYDENDKRRAIPCENCALTLPKKVKEDAPAQGKLDNSGPILRTRKPYERVSHPLEEPSPPKSASSTSSDPENNPITSKSHSRSSFSRTDTSSSGSSFGSATSHDHYVDYTSTHEPLTPSSFSIIRQSCLRTLSCETLPPSSATQFSHCSPTSPFINSPFSSGPSSSAASTSSGGPIFFGDPLAGYTTAYIFRIPDPNARGRRRVYALMALTTHRERLAMQAFSFLSVAFRDLASWIQSLAESELERSEIAPSPRSLVNGDAGGGRAFNGGGGTPTSSFLQGRNRGADGKFAGMSLRARGLAELVGLPDFFIELHTRFVRLLIELGVVLGS